jgi:hypothetical protein
VTTMMTIEEGEGHSACRLPMPYFAVQSLTYLASYVTAPSALPSEVVPFIVPVGTLTRLESTSEVSGLAVAISEVLDISLSEVQAQYFRDSDTNSEVDWVLGCSLGGSSGAGEIR